MDKASLDPIFSRLKSGLIVTDEDFDTLYSDRVKAISEFHFTPVAVAIAAAEYLVQEPGTKVLDIGSGAGKFCVIGAACTTGMFTGVEQRESLFQKSLLLSESEGLTNTRFLHANITEIDFQAFDAVYFFNAFFENNFSADPMEHAATMDKELFAAYNQYVRAQLSRMPVGTRLATYFSYLDEVPRELYADRGTGFEGKLRFWERVAAR